MLKMHQNTFAGQALPGPAGGVQVFLQMLYPQSRGATSNGTEKSRRRHLRFLPIKFDTRSALDVTVVCPLADSYVAAAAREACAVAQLAADRNVGSPPSRLGLY